MDVGKYAALFLAESREHLGACNQLLLEWERDPAATDPVGGLFRAVHTIKGMAATMGYAGVAELAHRTENLLDALRSGRADATADVFQLLFRAVDALGVGVEAAPGGADVGADAELLDELDHAGRPSARREPAARQEPAERREPAERVLEPPPDQPAPRSASSERRREARREEDAARPLLSRQIRVDLRRLDTLMRQVGELVVARNRLATLAAGARDPALEEVSARVSRLVTDMQAEVIAARMTPVGEVFERFPRLVRDLARELGKQIRFDMEGEEIELDRSILDEIGEPLLHLIRNAADHGIELPEERTAAGKPAEGRILLAAARERNAVAIRISDDGRGIDRPAILAKAKRDGLAGAEADTLADDLLIRVLARPGFSTAQAVSGVSGRGVGVDVAMTRVRALGGTLDVRSELGRGTTFIIRVPLTLAIVRALLAEASGERYAVPLAYVAETVEFDRGEVTALRGREALVVRDRVVPTVHLRELVGTTARGQTAPPVPPRRPTVILEVGERRTALVVDALLGQQEIVVEPFDAPHGMPPYVGGATILADGAPALILDAAALL